MVTIKVGQVFRADLILLRIIFAPCKLVLVQHEVVQIFVTRFSWNLGCLRYLKHRVSVQVDRALLIIIIARLLVALVLSLVLLFVSK